MTTFPPDSRCAPHSGRAFLRVSGPDRSTFLQGLVTCDLRKLGAEQALYGAMLTPQGKFLTDFFLVQQDQSILIDCPAACVEDLERRLSLFRLRTAVVLSVEPAIVTRGIGTAPPGALADPRHPSLGWRLYGTELSLGDPPDWDALRVAALVPETGAELIPGESFILELGFDRIGGVDFRKGCYVGQEVTARMHLKTDLRKGLVRVEVTGAAPNGTPLTNADGKPAGTLHTQAGGQGLALLRHDRAAGELRAGAARVVWPDAP